MTKEPWDFNDGRMLISQLLIHDIFSDAPNYEGLNKQNVVLNKTGDALLTGFGAMRELDKSGYKLVEPSFYGKRGGPVPPSMALGFARRSGTTAFLYDLAENTTKDLHILSPNARMSKDLHHELCLNGLAHVNVHLCRNKNNRYVYLHNWESKDPLRGINFKDSIVVLSINAQNRKLSKNGLNSVLNAIDFAETNNAYMNIFIKETCSQTYWGLVEGFSDYVLRLDASDTQGIDLRSARISEDPYMQRVTITKNF